jgi:hypothetical protein
MMNRPLRARMSTIKISKCSTALGYCSGGFASHISTAVQIYVDKRDDVLGAEETNETRTFRKQNRSTTVARSVAVCWSAVVYKSRVQISPLETDCH